MIAIASVILVITPISWILLHEPQNDEADASVPIVTRTDDTYVTPTTKPVVNPPSSKVSTPPVTPSATPTPTPTDSVTPGSTPATSDPTQAPTSRSTEAPTAPTRPTPTPDRTTVSRPTAPPTTNPPPPPDDGNMSADELQLFQLIDNARVDKGCAPLKRNSTLSAGAGANASQRAESGDTNSFGPSDSTAGGENWTAQQAFDHMMAQSRKTILNCGLTTLGVGMDDARYKTCVLGPVLCTTRTRVAWVADFT